MKYLLLLLFLVLPATGKAIGNDLHSLRALYYRAVADKAQADKFFTATNSIQKPLPIQLCYKGMAYMLRSKHAFNPYMKLSHFNKGTALIDSAAMQDPSNVEIRFMRYCVQSNIPSFLGYRSNMAGDRAMIGRALNSIEDVDLKEKIREYFARPGARNQDDAGTAGAD